MRFKIDENLPIEAAQLLRSAGHDATTVGVSIVRGESGGLRKPPYDADSNCQRIPGADWNRLSFAAHTQSAPIRSQKSVDRA